MLVVDTSALVAALADPAHPAARAMAADGDLHAPHLVDVELAHVLARLVRRRLVGAADADQLRTGFADLAIVRYPHQPLLERIWSLRGNLTAYDAAFVALAEILGAPLLTCDEALGRAPGHRAELRVMRAEP